jgi:hypothetical protein
VNKDNTDENVEKSDTDKKKKVRKFSDASDFFD